MDYIKARDLQVGDVVLFGRSQRTVTAVAVGTEAIAYQYEDVLHGASYEQHDLDTEVLVTERAH